MKNCMCSILIYIITNKHIEKIQSFCMQFFLLFCHFMSGNLLKEKDSCICFHIKNVGENMKTVNRDLQIKLRNTLFTKFSMVLKLLLVLL